MPIQIDAKSIVDLVAKEGWHLTKDKTTNTPLIEAEGETYPFCHPVLIHLKKYRLEQNPELKYQHMKAAHDYLWPDTVWHYWTERRFKTHCEDWKLVTWAGGAATGKAQPLNALIRTPSGWTTMGELKEGSIICDTYGGVQHVQKLHPQGIQDIYKVEFSDNSSCETTADHAWTVYSKKQRDHHSGPQILTTLEIKQNIQRNYSIPKHLAVEGYTKQLPIDPWLLGYYIGNGCLHKKSSATICCKNLSFAKKIQQIWPNSTITKYKDRNAYLVLCKGLRTILASIPELAFKKSYNKRIPKDYLYGSLHDRMSLLQGLIDADGSKEKKNTGCKLALSNKELIEDAADLARGLGYTISTRKTPKQTSYKNKNNIKIKCLPSYSLYISAQKPGNLYHRRIVKIEKVRQDYAQCITVSSSNNLYITNDYIVTHNSFDAAKIACEFWLADPRNRAVIVASSSLESLNARIWGYCTRFMHEMQVPLPFNYRRGAPPKILFEARDTIHGMFAVAAKRGDDDAAISNWIGRHPNKGLLLVLDEGTELPMAILNALPNLEAGQDNFQCIVIGNSLSHYDLHGSLSTPKHGWKSIDPETHTKWETTQKKGLCLFFSCYESPAIGEPDKERKKKLSKFLITKEEIDSKIKVYGSSSDSFYRFVLGFWRSEGTEDTVLSKVFLNEFHIREKAEWSGIHELSMVAGLDPAFSTGGDSCILRLGILGLDVNGNLLLDFRGDELLFKIEILALSDVSIETQIANQVIAILSSYRCQIGNMAVDATGQGRALAEVIRLQAKTLKAPLKIWSTKLGNMQKNSFDVILKSTLELWTDVRDFISTDQIRGLDNESINQFASRLIEIKGAKQTLESKADYKKRMGAISPRLAHSPDEADSVALCVQAAKICFGFTPGVTHQEKRIESFEMEKWYAQLHARAVEERASTVCAPQATFSNPDFAPINMFQGFKRD